MNLGRELKSTESGTEFQQLLTRSNYFFIYISSYTTRQFAIGFVLAWCYSCTVEHLDVEKPLEIPEVYESFSHISAEVLFSVVFLLIK